MPASSPPSAVPAPLSSGPSPPPSTPPTRTPSLPPGYRFVSDPDAITARLPDIYAALTHPEIYWGRDRTPEILATQIEHSWRAIMVLKGGEGSDGELAAFCRVVSDGWDFGYLADVLTIHRGAGLSRALVHEAVHNSSRTPEKTSDAWKWSLFTKDAHWLYEKEGFAANLSPSMTRWPHPLPSPPSPA